MTGWIGVDLDGTLAYSDPSIPEGAVGQPIYRMVQRVLQWRAQGKDVRIFTARPARDYRTIEAFCMMYLHEVLPITDRKDPDMTELWDDRAVQVIPNTGERADRRLD